MTIFFLTMCASVSMHIVRLRPKKSPNHPMNRMPADPDRKIDDISHDSSVSLIDGTVRCELSVCKCRAVVNIQPSNPPKAKFARFPIVSTVHNITRYMDTNNGNLNRNFYTHHIWIPSFGIRLHLLRSTFSKTSTYNY